MFSSKESGRSISSMASCAAALACAQALCQHQAGSLCNFHSYHSGVRELVDCVLKKLSGRKTMPPASGHRSKSTSTDTTL